MMEEKPIGMFQKNRGWRIHLITVAFFVVLFLVPGVSAQLADTSWPMFHHNVKHTGQSQYNGSQTNNLKWTFNAEGDITNSPILAADGTIYLGLDLGAGSDKFLAVYPNGTLRWEVTISQPVTSSPALASDGTIYVGAYNDNLYAFHPNGTEKWTYTTGGDVHSSPAVWDDGTIYVGSRDDNLYAIYPNGTKKWNFTTGGDVESEPAIGDDGTIYVGSDDSNLYAVYPNGTLKWNYTTGSQVTSAPAIASDGTIYVGSDDSKLYAIFPNGTLRWTYNAGNPVKTSPAIALDDTIYLGASLFKIEALYPNGTLKWDYSNTGASDIASASIGADGTIYIGTSQGIDTKIYALNPDGTLKWNYTADSGIFSSPAINADGTVYVASLLGGNLYSFGGPVWNTRTGQNYQSIQEAVNNASTGDTIRVATGSYSESVDVNKSVNLVGAGAEVTIVQAASSSDHVFNVTKNSVNISGFTVTGANGVGTVAGIYVNLANNTNISNNVVTNNKYGILYDSFPQISRYNQISNNTAFNNTYGIYLKDSENSSIRNNNASSNTYGIFLDEASNYLKSNNVTNNIVNSNTGDGISLWYSSGNTIANNTVSKNYNGIYFSSSNSNTIINNTANSNRDGIVIKFSNNNTLTNNNASDNSQYGISLTQPCTYNTITNNNASDNTYGIAISNSYNNAITKNTFSSNSEKGIYFWSSYNNTIYDNFFNNTANVQFAGTIYTNDWNTTNTNGPNVIGGPYIGGNFWAHPNGTGFSETCMDVNNDWFCDTEYSLQSGNVDYLPLTTYFWLAYYSDDLDDDGEEADDVFKLVSKDGVSVNATADGDEINVSKADYELVDLNAGFMWFDMDGDYRLDSTTDYPLYSGLYTYIINRPTVQPYLNVLNATGVVDSQSSVDNATVFNSSTEDSKGYGYLGRVFKIHGTKYIVIKETDTETATIAPLLKASPASFQSGSNPKDYAVTLTGTLKVAYTNDSTYKGTLYLYDSDSLLNTIVIGGTAANRAGSEYVGYLLKTDLPDEFSGLKMFYKIEGTTGVTVVAGEKSAGTTISNAETGVLGYNTLYLYMGTGNNPQFSKVQDGIYFMGDAVSLLEGDKVDIPDTLFELDLAIDNRLDLLKKETVSVSSGSKLKYTSSSYADFLNKTITVVVTGSDIQITYGSDDIDDDTSTTDKFKNITEGGVALACDSTSCDEISTSTAEGELVSLNMSSSGVMKFDMDGDLRLDDVTDYPLYSGLYVIDKTTVKPYLNVLNTTGVIDSFRSVDNAPVFTSSAEDSKGYGYLGKVFKIHGTKYIVIKETDTETATIAPLLKASPASFQSGSNPKDYAVTLTGTLRVAYMSGGNYNGTLYLYDSDSLLKTLAVGGTSANRAGSEYVGYLLKTDLPDEFSGLKMFYKIEGTTGVTVVAGEKSQGTTISNGETGVLGYERVYLFMGSGNNPEFSRVQDGLYLMGDAVSLIKGDKVEIPDTLFELDLDISNALDLLRKKTVNVSNGTEMKDSSSVYSDFLDETIAMTVVYSSDIQITYGSDDIDDDTSTTDVFDLTSLDGTSVNATIDGDEISTSSAEGHLVSLNMTAGSLMKFDMDGDLKLDDATDYPLYSGLYITGNPSVQSRSIPYLDVLNATGVVDSQSSVDNATVFNSSTEDSKGYGYLGKVFKIQGTKYVVIKETDTGTATIAPLLNATLSSFEPGSNPKDYAVTLTGTLKVAYTNDSTYKGTLYLYDSDSLLNTIVIGGTAANRAGSEYVGYLLKTDLPDEFSGLKMFYKIEGTTGVTVVAGEKSQGTTTSNGETGVLGYDTVYLYMGSGNNPEFSKVQDGLYCMGGSVNLTEGEHVNIPDSYYSLYLGANSNLDLLRRNTTSIPPVINSGPTVSSITTSSATITWTTDKVSNSTVEYGTSTGYGSSTGNSSYVTSHSMTLTGLSSSTTYHYRVISADMVGNTNTSGDYSFTTSSAGGNGGGGGGGAGKGIGYIIKKILGGEKGVAHYDLAESPVTEITVKTKNTVYNIKIEVEELEDKPRRTMPDPPGRAFKYMKITKSKIDDSDIEEAEIKFQVDVEWLIENDIDPDTTGLCRYTDGEWEQLDTELLETDSDYAYFSATTGGFSYFSITGEVGSGYKVKEILEVPVVASPPKEETGETLEELRKQTELMEEQLEEMKKQSKMLEAIVNMIKTILGFFGIDSSEN